MGNTLTVLDKLAGSLVTANEGVTLPSVSARHERVKVILPSRFDKLPKWYECRYLIPILPGLTSHNFVSVSPSIGCVEGFLSLRDGLSLSFFPQTSSFRAVWVGAKEIFPPFAPASAGHHGFLEDCCPCPSGTCGRSNRLGAARIRLVPAPGPAEI